MAALRLAIGAAGRRSGVLALLGRPAGGALEVCPLLAGHVRQSSAVSARRGGVTASKAEDFSSWYTQVITKSEMIEYYDISGCYILRPWAFSIWEKITEELDLRIKREGVQNAYFPCFVSQDALEAERSHVEGFAPEVAWVTRSGTSDFKRPIAVRPTSETIMYPAFAKWIRSHRDLPLKLNQWSNIVRWEFKQPTPFLRTREFLWQEGHTAHATREEAEDTVATMLDHYAEVYEQLLAVPVVKGRKSESEKFAGGQSTLTLEAFIPTSGRGIQAATSHHLGTNFASMFDISYEDAMGQRKLVEQTSWGFTTRALGIMVMVHGDDRGLVLPPRVAQLQAVIVPIYPKGKNGNASIDARCQDLRDSLRAAGVRADADLRANHSSGWKFHWWELKGTPLRIELGPRDLERGTCRVVRRDSGEGTDLPQADLGPAVQAELGRMHADMLGRATRERDGAIARVTEWGEVAGALSAKKLVLAPWGESAVSEEAIKEATRGELGAPSAPGELTGAMKSLCIPLEQPHLPPGTRCFWTGEPARRWCLFGRSY